MKDIEALRMTEAISISDADDYGTIAHDRERRIIVQDDGTRRYYEDTSNYIRKITDVDGHELKSWYIVTDDTGEDRFVSYDDNEGNSVVVYDRDNLDRITEIRIRNVDTKQVIKIEYNGDSLKECHRRVYDDGELTYEQFAEFDELGRMTHRWDTDGNESKFYYEKLPDGNLMIKSSHREFDEEDDEFYDNEYITICYPDGGTSTYNDIEEYNKCRRSSID